MQVPQRYSSDKWKWRGLNQGQFRLTEVKGPLRDIIQINGSEMASITDIIQINGSECLSEGVKA